MTEARLEKIKNVLNHRQGGLTVIMENIHDPHNIYACMRTCDAVGVQEVHIVDYRENSFRAGKRSSSTAKRWLSLYKYNTLSSCFEAVRAKGKKIYTTHLSEDAKSIYDFDFTDDIAIVFGNEKVGVSPEAVHLADGNLVIPQVGMIKSLNISVALAVTLYEAYRQRNAKGFYDEPNLSKVDYNNLLKQWSSK